MSEYPYEDKIHSDDRINYKTVYSSDRIKFGEVEAAFIVKLEKESNMEIKYEIPRLEISSLTNDRIILKLKQSDIDEISDIINQEKLGITVCKNLNICSIGSALNNEPVQAEEKVRTCS